MSRPIFVDLAKAESDPTYIDAVRRVSVSALDNEGGYTYRQADGSRPVAQDEFERRIHAALTGNRTSKTDIDRLVPLMKASGAPLFGTLYKADQATHRYVAQHADVCAGGPGLASAHRALAALPLDARPSIDLRCPENCPTCANVESRRDTLSGLQDVLGSRYAGPDAAQASGDWDLAPGTLGRKNRDGSGLPEGVVQSRARGATFPPGESAASYNARHGKPGSGSPAAKSERTLPHLTTQDDLDRWTAPVAKTEGLINPLTGEDRISHRRAVREAIEKGNA
jgi:hypothetical protein